MKKAVFSLLFLALFFSARAQTPKEKVEDAVEKLRLAMISGKKADLENISSNHLSYGHSNGNVQNKAQFVDAIVSGKSDFVTIEITNQIVDVAGTSAVVRHVLTADTNDNKKPGKVKLAILLVFEQEGGQWKLLARQAVKPAK